MDLVSRKDKDEEVVKFVSPYQELNAGLWTLFIGATFFLALRVWVKVFRRSHRLWYDDYVLIVSWGILFANNILIVYEFATGYILEDSSKKWDDRMHILINISSCGTLIGQAWTKTAFGLTLLRMSNRWQRWLLWFCISTMNVWMIVKVIVQWAKLCGKASYQNWYRLDFCVSPKFRDDFKEGGNVYNIIMDFIFACIPWLIVRGLEMRRIEKIGLCCTMSLGIIVAIVSAIRIGWKDDGNDRDKYYIYRNGLSQVWYSSEIAGTIIVQCIPILRPILRDIHTSIKSKSLSTTGDRRSRAEAPEDRAKILSRSEGSVQLDDIPIEQQIAGRQRSHHSGPDFQSPRATAKTPEPFVMAPPKTTRILEERWRSSRTRLSLDVDQDRSSNRSSMGYDTEQHSIQGLTAPPRTGVYREIRSFQ